MCTLVITLLCHGTLEMMLLFLLLSPSSSSVMFAGLIPEIRDSMEFNQHENINVNFCKFLFLSGRNNKY